MAQCSLISCKNIFDDIKYYLENKNIPNSTFKLYGLPSINKLFTDFYNKYDNLISYCNKIEYNLCYLIKNKKN